MSRLLQNINDEDPYEVKFDKDYIINDIKNRLPEPWMWYTINDSMNNENYPSYDLLIIRNKKVKEEVLFEIPFRSIKKKIDSTYSIVLGINVVDIIKNLTNTFDTSMRDTLVTASIEVGSARDLLCVLREIDSCEGGIIDD